MASLACLRLRSHENCDQSIRRSIGLDGAVVRQCVFFSQNDVFAVADSAKLLTNKTDSQDILYVAFRLTELELHRKIV